eukprot:GHVU01115037.1.p2 GENE.GHVU01115037.1~~GHVU01115037.1.p2  ORF type:complete len:103 (+),score=2.65 GHVU01115037.1:388-696(+)
MYVHVLVVTQHLCSLPTPFRRAVLACNSVTSNDDVEINMQEESYLFTAMLDVVTVRAFFVTPSPWRATDRKRSDSNGRYGGCRQVFMLVCALSNDKATEPLY